MKRMFLALVVLYLAVTTVQGNEPNEPNQPAEEQSFVSLRLMSEPEFKDGVANLEAWLGFGKGPSETGFVLGYEAWQDEDDTESKISIGAFTMYHLPDARQALEDIIWPVELLPEGIMATPAIGISGLLDLEDNGVKVSPVVELTVYESIAIQTKYNILAFEEDAEVSDKWQIGLSAKWKF